MGDAGGEPEVNEFGSGLGLVQKNILELNVSVGYIPQVQVMDAKYHLLP